MRSPKNINKWQTIELIQQTQWRPIEKSDHKVRSIFTFYQFRLNTLCVLCAIVIIIIINTDYIFFFVCLYLGLVCSRLWSSSNAYKCVDRFTVSDLQSICLLLILLRTSINQVLYYLLSRTNEEESNDKKKQAETCQSKWNCISEFQVERKKRRPNICDTKRKIWNIKSEILSSLTSISLTNCLRFATLWNKPQCCLTRPSVIDKKRVSHWKHTLLLLSWNGAFGLSKTLDFSTTSIA